MLVEKDEECATCFGYIRDNVYKYICVGSPIQYHTKPSITLPIAKVISTQNSIITINTCTYHSIQFESPILYQTMMRIQWVHLLYSRHELVPQQEHHWECRTKSFQHDLHHSPDHLRYLCIRNPSLQHPKCDYIRRNTWLPLEEISSVYSYQISK